MADVDFDDFDGAYGSSWGEQAARNRMSRIVHVAGAACSIGLVLGMVFWGYRIAVRDVHGIPVIRAMDGPMRIAPENPGGEVADHQGLAVNTVAALGTAAPPPDRLVLAPRPVELSYEDAPGLALEGELPAVPETLPVSATPVTLATPLAGEGIAAPVENTGPDPDAVAMALAEALAEPMPDDLPQDDPAVAVASAADPAAPLRPRARPGSAPVTLSEPAAPMPMAAEVDPSMIPAGTRLAQLGAFDTADLARSEWVKLANQFGPLLEGKALVVQAAESGGRTFYRLRAHGFADETEARSFCTRMVEQNASCIPVEQR